MDEDGVPRLAPGWEARGDGLSPAEGFLLSRIDGCTSWRMLRQIAGLPPEEVDRYIEQWVSDGLVVLESGPPRNGEEAKSDAGSGGLSLDPMLDLSLDIQEQVLAFERKLDGPYHQILGVARDADERDIKRAYFDLSKLFHPDRYFGRDVGPFAERLDRIFKKVALAYELLMDPATRAEVERSMASAPPPDQAPPAAPIDASGAPRKLTKRETLDRLRRQFRIPKEILSERRSKARLFHEASRVACHQQKWNEAASSVRLAIAFDPWTDEYKEDFAAIQAEVNQLRAAELLQEASGAIDSRSAVQALKLLEEAMGYRPSDAEVHALAAHAACEIQDFERAHEYAERACELAPGLAAHHLVRARSLRGQGLREKARAALEEACKLEPGNEEVKEELRRLRKVPGRARGGKP